MGSFWNSSKKTDLPWKNKKTLFIQVLQPSLNANVTLNVNIKLLLVRSIVSVYVPAPFVTVILLKMYVA